MSELRNYCLPENNSTLQSTLFHETEALVSVKNNQVVTTSLQIAEYFGKEHSKVLRAINQLDCSSIFRQANFGLSCYTKKNGNISKSYPMYYMTRDGFTLLAMGFTGKNEFCFVYLRKCLPLRCDNNIQASQESELFGMRGNITSPIIRSYILRMYVVVANLDYVEAFFFLLII